METDTTLWENVQKLQKYNRTFSIRLTLEQLRFAIKVGQRRQGTNLRNKVKEQSFSTSIPAVNCHIIGAIGEIATHVALGLDYSYLMSIANTRSRSNRDDNDLHLFNLDFDIKCTAAKVPLCKIPAKQLDKEGIKNYDGFIFWKICDANAGTQNVEDWTHWDRIQFLGATRYDKTGSDFLGKEEWTLEGGIQQKPKYYFWKPEDDHYVKDLSFLIRKLHEERKAMDEEKRACIENSRKGGRRKLRKRGYDNETVEEERGSKRVRSH